MTDEAAAVLIERLTRQARYCAEFGSPLYAMLLERAAGDLATGGPVRAILEGREADPPDSSLALRLMGAVHRLVLDGRAPELARYYPSAGGRRDPAGAWPALRATLEARLTEVRALLERPIQTNEVGRSAALLGGFLLVARATGLPLRVLELGASAGLNLRWDHYRYEAGDAAWGDPASPVRFSDVFIDGAPPLDTAARVIARAGCDPAPVDPATPDGRLTLLSYLWPDQAERLARLRAALEVARRVPVRIDRAEATEWLAAQLATATAGVATVVFHSIVMQYLAPADRDRIRAILDEAGRRATPETPLARLRMEPAGDLADVHLTLWPGGEKRRIARAHYHGRPVHWLGG